MWPLFSLKLWLSQSLCWLQAVGVQLFGGWGVVGVGVLVGFGFLGWVGWLVVLWEMEWVRMAHIAVCWPGVLFVHVCAFCVDRFGDGRLNSYFGAQPKQKVTHTAQTIPLSFPPAFGLLVWLASYLFGCLLLVRWLVGWLVFVWLVHTLSFVCLSLFFLVLHRYRRSPRTLVGTVGSGCSKNCLSLPFPLWPYRCYRSGSFDFV